MAIDLRQEQQHRQHPEAPPRRRGTVWMVAVALIAIFAIGAVMTVVALRDQPTPAGGVTILSYPEGASTTGREGGVYVVVPASVAGYTDTAAGVREGGDYVTTTWDEQKLDAFEARLQAG
jgi:hypothetical protein